MQFNVNSPILFLLSGIIVAIVLAQSVYFLVKAWRRGKEIGMPMDKLKRIVLSTAVFTVAPATAIVISVISLSKKLGIPLPWMRLSVVGAVTVAAVMTLGIMTGGWMVPLVGKKLIGGMINLEKRDKKWGEIFSASLFLGMISAFLGYVFCDMNAVFHGNMSGLIAPLVMFVSAAMMGVCALALKKLGWRWMNDYALPISLLVGMASAIPITAWLG